MITSETPSSIERGHAHLTVDVVSGQSAATSSWASNPIKILVPKPRGPSVWAYSSSFGGGMVGGDQTHLDLSVGAMARCHMGTQASTKIYRNLKRAACSHFTRARLGPNSLLVFAPDPVQAFADSTYTQRQEFYLEAGASLVLLDWFNSGRAARGERWAFSRFSSRNDVFLEGERIYLDSILLDPSSGPLDTPMRAGRFNCFATLLIVGDMCGAAIEQILKNILARPVEKKSPLVVSASSTRGGVVLRVSGERVEDVGREIRGHLAFAHEFLGDDPWARKW
jgi:urease accessory protein